MSCRASSRLRLVGHLRSVGRAALLAALLALLASGLTAAAPSLATAEQTQVSEGSLTWGVKESFRNYIRGIAHGDIEVAGGATENGDGTFAFPVASGAYEPETKATSVQFAGSVHFSGHGGSLDFTLSDLRIEITPEETSLYADASSRPLSGGEPVGGEDQLIATLDVANVEPEVAEGTTTWAGVPSKLAAAAVPLFAGEYTIGTVLDPLTLRYAGPGGKPAPATEDWSEPGTRVFETTFSDRLTDAWRAVAFDREANVVHALIGASGDGVAGVRFQAYDAATLEPVGEPTPVYPGFDNQTRVAYDPAGKRLFARMGESPAISMFAWDAASQRYTATELAAASALPTAAGDSNTMALVWDAANSRVLALLGTRDNATLVVITYNAIAQRWNVQQVRQSTGALDVGDYRPADLAVTPSGTILAPSPFDNFFPGPVLDLTFGLALPRKVVGRPIPGTVTEVLPEQHFMGYPNAHGWRGVVPVDGSSFYAFEYESPARVAKFAKADGAWTQVGPEVRTDQRFGVGPGLSQHAAVVADPSDGTLFVGYKLVRDGRVIGELPVANPNLSKLVADGGRIYASINSSRWVFDEQGRTPSFTAQPQDARVSLGDGQSAGRATFSAEAAGAPVPTLQWQTRPPGSTSIRDWADVEGQTGATLSVSASALDHGRQYRVVATNDVGALASRAVMLAVDTAPTIAVPPRDVTVTAGADAVFTAMAVGQPAPAVRWERYADGNWVAIGADDSGYVVDGGQLVVQAANVDQSGTRFRARAANDAGRAYSPQATLTVTPRTTVPNDGLSLRGVALDWTGSEELQSAPPAGGSNYFSAGASSGDEASYRATQGDVAVYQVAADGGRSVATYATRAAHVANGGRQLVRLTDGRARVALDGSATVRWTGAFSVNFYGGMLPFTLTDPELVVEADGDGRLVADLSGYKSSMANPMVKEPVAPAADVTVATFSGVEIDPGGKVTVEPHYPGIEVAVAPPAAAQDRTAPGWGAWPQPFVDFHLVTGLSSYWYTSGSAADPKKPPLSFVVDFAGARPDVVDPPVVVTPPGAGGGAQPVAVPQVPAPSAPDQAPAADQAPAPPVQQMPSTSTPVTAPTIRPALGTRTVGRAGRVSLATVVCRAACTLTAPSHVRVTVAGQRYTLAVSTPRRLAAGGRAVVRVGVPSVARKALRGRRATVRLRLVVRSGGERTVRTLQATLRG